MNGGTVSAVLAVTIKNGRLKRIVRCRNEGSGVGDPARVDKPPAFAHKPPLPTQLNLRLHLHDSFLVVLPRFALLEHGPFGPK